MFLKNKNFFDCQSPVKSENETALSPRFSEESEEETRVTDNDVDLSVYDEAFMERLHKLEDYCKEANRKDLIVQISDIKEYLSSKRFTVAVVGEFNRGKSTLVNRLIDRDIIPTSDIPTTTLPIRVSGGKQELLTLRMGAETKTYPLTEKSWESIDKIRENNKGKQGEILLKCNCSLLMQHDLEIIDTPGVNSQIQGDFSMAEQALNECDCAILTMTAISPFSESESLFLQERILMKKIPRIMVIITKLDLVEESQRTRVIESIRSKVKSINAEIPLYLSSEGLVEEWEEKSGVKAIRKQILDWMQESSHASLKKERACQGVRTIVADLTAVYTCQLEVIAEKEEKRKEVAEQKKQQLLRSLQIQWDSLEIEMLKRCNHNFEWIRNMTEDRQQDIIEKLLFELSHVTNPKDWWERDYPYRMKMEMISLGNTLESNLQAFYNRDTNWLNQVLQEKYSSVVPPQNQRIADKTIFRSSIIQGNVELEDMKRTRLVSRVGTGVATIGGYFVGGLLGLGPLGMAVGIGGGILSEVFMNKRVDAQKRELSRIITEQLPTIFSDSIATVEQNIRGVYVSTILAMKKACSDWVKVKCDAIDNAQNQAEDPKNEESIRQKIDCLKNLGV